MPGRCGDHQGRGPLSAARGRLDAGGFLTEIHETKGIEKAEDGNARYPNAEGGFTEVPEDTLVSMNMFGFTPVIMKELAERFPKALDQILASDPLKGEFFIPEVVGELVEEGKARVQVIPCGERWFGVTYQEDKPLVVSAMQEKKKQGLYPEKLWK